MANLTIINKLIPVDKVNYFPHSALFFPNHLSVKSPFPELLKFYKLFIHFTSSSRVLPVFC
ncbi:hypothetical protein ABIC45_003002 [Mucilaginibacter rubeus]